METFTAKEITGLLRRDDPAINLRTVRYYTQIGIVPPLETVGNRRVYTERHLHYFRAIMTLSRSGDTLASIREKLDVLTAEEIVKLGEHLPLYRSEQLLENETHAIGDDVILSISPRVSAELRARMIETVSNMLKGAGER